MTINLRNNAKLNDYILHYAIIYMYCSHTHPYALCYISPYELYTMHYVHKIYICHVSVNTMVEEALIPPAAAANKRNQIREPIHKI